MQRYHTTGIGKGIAQDVQDAYRSKNNQIAETEFYTTMWETDKGYWVLYDDVQAEIKKAKQEGYEQAHKDLASTNQIVDANHSRFDSTNPEKQSKRAAAIDEYLNPTHPKFPKGTRVNHKYHRVPGTVIGDVRNRGAGYEMDVEVRFDNGHQDYCHLVYMTPLVAAYVPPTEGEIFWSAFNKAGISGADIRKDTQLVSMPTDSVSKRLLNELYHDRARLERETKRAAAMLKRFIAGLNDDLKRGDLAEIESYGNLIGEATEFANANE
jgi:hypothetical protein